MILYYIKRILLISIVLMCACRPVVEDPVDFRLPKYTELGYGVSGALINNKPKSFNYSKVSFTYRSSENSLLINMGSFFFKLKNTDIKEYDDLWKLKNNPITLDGINNNAWYINSINDSLLTCNGQFYAKCIKERHSGMLIFAGTFGFYSKLKSNNSPVNAVEYGRFDYTINRWDFIIIK